jgi:hypothetical protein
MWVHAVNDAWTIGETITIHAQHVQSAVGEFNENRLQEILVDVLGFAVGVIVRGWVGGGD